MMIPDWTEKMDAAEKDIIAAKKQNWIDNTVLDPESIYAGDTRSAAQAAEKKNKIKYIFASML